MMRLRGFSFIILASLMLAHLISAFLHGDNVANNEAGLARCCVFNYPKQFEAQPAPQDRSTALRLHKRSPLPLDAEEVDKMLDRIVGKVDKHNEQVNHKKSGKWADRGMILMLEHHQGSKDQVKHYNEKLSGLTKDAGEEKKEKMEKTLKFWQQFHTTTKEPSSEDESLLYFYHPHEEGETSNKEVVAAEVHQKEKHISHFSHPDSPKQKKKQKFDIHQ